MALFKKKKLSLAENEHYTLRCNQCGQDVVNIPGEHTPEMQYFFHSKTMGVALATNGCTITYSGLQDFFTLQVSADQNAIISITLEDCIALIHAHLITHNKPLFMLFSDTSKEDNAVNHVYFSKEKAQIMGLKSLEYHGVDFGVLHDRGRAFEFNPTSWPSIVVATSPNIKIKGYPMMGTDYAKAVLPGIHLKCQTCASIGDYQQQVKIAVADLSAMCATAVLGSSLEKNRDNIRNLGKELFDAHGMKAMQAVFAAVMERYPMLRSQLSSIWNGIGDWAN